MKTLKDFEHLLMSISANYTIDSERMMSDGSLKSEISYYSSDEENFVTLTEVTNELNGFKERIYIIDQVEEDEIIRTVELRDVTEAVTTYGALV